MKIPYEQKKIFANFLKNPKIYTIFVHGYMRGKIEKMEVLNEQKRSTQRIAFAVYTQAERAAVYRSGYVERVRRE